MNKKELINKRMKHIVYLTTIILVMIVILTISFFVENTILMIILYFGFSACLIYIVPFMFNIYQYNQVLKSIKGE